MSHNVLLDLTDTHYQQHLLAQQQEQSSISGTKFIPTRHTNNHYSSGTKQFNIPSNFHDLLILLKRIFWSHRWPRFIKFYMTLILTCIIIFTLFFNYSPSPHSVAANPTNHHLKLVKTHKLTNQQKSNITNDEIDAYQLKAINVSIQTSISGYSFTSRAKSDSPYKPRGPIGRFRPLIEPHQELNSNPIENEGSNDTISHVESNIQSSNITYHPQHQLPNYEQNDHAPLNPSIGLGLDIYSGHSVAMSPPSMPSTSIPKTFVALTAKNFQIEKLNKNQLDIREAMVHSWKNYKRYAWGYDMLRPRARRPDHWFNLGLTIVDSVDTLIMMNLQDEANEALDWIESDLDYEHSNKNANCFELTIRILGGLLSAHHLKPERTKVLAKAIDLGERLLHCYDTDSSVVPNSDIDLAFNQSHPPLWYPYSSLSEVSSIQLEFRDLTRLTGRANFEKITFMTSLHLHNITVEQDSALLAMYIDPAKGKMDNSRITLGARADSYYEYLIKQYLQTDIKWLEDDYLKAIDEIKDKLLKTTYGEMNLTYIAEVQKYRTVDGIEELDYQNKMDHLVCFLPGSLILGYYHFSPKAAILRSRHGLFTPHEKLNNRYDYHLGLAESIGRTCFSMYNSTVTGLSPEIAFFGSANDKMELIIQSTSAHNILRPEFVESLFYLYHITGKQVYREQARQVFDSFNKYCRVPGGYSPIADVRNEDSSVNLDRASDRMESFWMSETLKYLYLIFCDDKAIISRLLNDYILNTEAHIIPRNYYRLGLKSS